MGLLKLLQSVLEFLLAMYLVTFFHELGHVLPGLALTDYRGFISLGPFDSREHSRELRLGRLHLRWHGFGFFMGKAYFDGEEFSKSAALLSVAGGPLISLVLGLVLLLLANTSEGFALQSFARFVGRMFLIQFLITGIPMRYPKWLGDYAGMTSDGLEFLRLLRAK